jgi:hypothetical protein
LYIANRIIIFAIPILAVGKKEKAILDTKLSIYDRIVANATKIASKIIS